VRLPIIHADGHVIEPMTLWRERFPFEAATTSALAV
jgi:hypothetical protein